MRLGGSVMKPYDSPEQWLAHVKELTYSVVIAPVNTGADAATIKAYRDCAGDNNLLIGEVGVWKNPISPDDKERRESLAYAIGQLALAEELGANCCVNICGSRGDTWDGCYTDNYAKDTYALIVDSVREIIDAVKPQNTYYSLEPMPWMHPDSPEDYLQMIRDIDRPRFSVHLDYTNMINSVDKYLNASRFIEHCFELLGPHIKSIHAKDVRLTGLPCGIHEVPPGDGVLDLRLVLRLSHRLGADTPVFVEHLPDHQAYLAATKHMRMLGETAGVPIQ